MPLKTRLIWIGAGALWIAVIVAGGGALIRYQLEAGREGLPPRQWPAATRVTRWRDGYTLVLVAHPRCACTRASVSELEYLLARLRDRLQVRVLFVEPEDFDGTRPLLWSAVASLAGALPIIDVGGREAHAFDAYTSGQVALYDPSGRLTYSGGITGARGHAGANPGRDAVLQIVRDGSTTAHTSVFGCGLVTPKAPVAAVGASR